MNRWGWSDRFIPWNFPLLMAAWKLAPALAAGNCVVLKPAEQTPLSITLLLELIGDLFPAGVLNVVQGFGKRGGRGAGHQQAYRQAGVYRLHAGRAAYSRLRGGKYYPLHRRAGGKSPNIYFADVMDGEEEFIEKAVEGLVLGFFNQGEVCTCPSRALIHESIYEPFMARVMEKVAQIRRGDPLDTDTMIGAQASRQQFDKILSYIQIAREEGGQILTGGERAAIAPALDNGFYIQPTLIKGRNDMRSFQEEIFGPVIGVTTFKDEAEALAIANETQFGLGAGVWTRDTNLAYRMGRGIKAGRVWTNCYHVYPAHAAFGGYKQSGVGRETHKMALDAYQQTKNLLVSYGTAPLGLF
ncbi:aldehyde dehydrogenase [Klebsiella pneumoniae]|uniref:Aldehyde dehydrogenase n=1 Tax=Klebsiella pneumoniae TaxID=573 RepID=A0A3S4GD20_KLEPN|nr:aldehyde dehydrogenase [Klebsiella pneumoniae]